MTAGPPAGARLCRNQAPAETACLAAVFVLVLVLVLVSSCAPGPSDPDEPAALHPGQRWTLAFPAGETRELSLSLRQGWVLALALHQQGLDVASRLVDPAGKTLVEMDTDSGRSGTEEIAVVAGQPGVHRLRLEAVSRREDGRVEVEVLDYRPAKASDRQRSQALAAMARGRLAWLADDLPTAVSALGEALPDLVALGDHPRETEARHLLGLSLEQQEKREEAAEELTRAQEGFRALGRPADEALVSNELGRVLSHLGRSLAAEAAYRRALALARRADAGFVEAAALHNLGALAMRQGELEEALDLFEQALALRRKIGPPAQTSGVLRRLASVYTLIGRDEDALVLAEEANGLVDADSPPKERARLLDDLAWTRYWAGKPEAALADYGQAIELAQRAGDEALEVSLLARRLTVLRGLGRLDEARADARRVLRWRQAVGERAGEGSAWLNLGRIDLEADDLEAARVSLTRAVALLAESDGGEDRFITFLSLGQVARRTGRWQEGREALEGAITAAQGMRGDLTSRLSRGSLLSVRFEVYEELIGLLMDQDRAEPGQGHDLEALEVAERSRGQGLLEDLAGREESSDATSETPTLRRIRGLELKRLELQRTERDSRKLERLDEQLRRLWLEAERSPALAAPRHVAAHHLTVTQMQALVDPETRLLVFSLGEPESYVWVLGPGSVRSFRLAGGHQLSELARETASALARSDGSFSRRSSLRRASELSQALLAPAADALDARRLVFAPDGALYLVPFAALPDPARAPGSDGLLVDRFEISIVASPSVLALQRETAPSSSTTRVAVLADPVYEADDDRLTGEPASPAELSGDLQRSVDALDLSRLPRLYHTAEEARAILALLPPGKGLLLEGFAANRERVTRGELSGYPIVHFAAHGLIHPVHPELSGIVLSLLDSEGQPEDGFLRAYEVARLDLPAKLVVLSACRTALGHEVRGEAPIGLVQAFHRAGARRVVASGWKVDDAATALLMDRFYAALLEEARTPAAALREAQLALRHSDAWHEPYYWAAFELHGDWKGSLSQQDLE